MKRLLALTAALAAFSFTGGAAATPGPTPNGETGACNMVNTYALSGMLLALGVDNPLGTTGMITAIEASAGSTDCP